MEMYCCRSYYPEAGVFVGRNNASDSCYRVYQIFFFNDLFSGASSVNIVTMQ